MAKFEVNFFSYALRHGVDIEVTIPSFSSCDYLPGIEPTHRLDAKFPVLYLLHGHGNDRKCWSRYTSVERLAEEQRIAVVAFDTQNKAYNNMPAGDNYFDFLNKELPEFICSMFPVSDRREDTYIAGVSMGGYGTMVHAFSHPERYCAFAAISPAASMRPAEKSKYGRSPAASSNYDSIIEPMDELQARLEEKAILPKGYLCIGEQDFLFDSLMDFKKDVDALGLDFTWDILDGYEHEWRFWDLEIGKFLKWIPRTDYYADQPNHI